jgi:hypothetical protein
VATRRAWVGITSLLSLLLLTGVASAQTSLASIPPEILDLCQTLGSQVTGKGNASVLSIVQTDAVGRARPSPPSIGALECHGGPGPKPPGKLPPPTAFRLVIKGTP